MNIPTMSADELEASIDAALAEEEAFYHREVLKGITPPDPIRQFATGATRDATEGKYEPWGFLSPLALHRFCEYMHKHRLQADGKLRSADNWKKGMPIPVYLQSLMRHVFDFWLVTSGHKPRFDTKVSDPKEIACAILFNIQGYLHEVLKAEENQQLAIDSEKEFLSLGSAADGLCYIDPQLSADVERAFQKIQQ